MYCPLVSIIIPVYNSAKFLNQTIQSALNQTHSNIEIIVIDDGSTDESFRIAESYITRGIKVFKQKNNGASAARNLGLLHSTGEFIQFLDADDLLSKNKIENQIQILQEKPGYVSICSTIHFCNDINIESLIPSNYEDYFLKSTGDPTSFLINLWGGNTEYGSMVSIHSWLTPKNIIEKAGLWNESLTYDDDGEYFARVVLKAEGIEYVQKGYCYYRKHPSDSLSTINSEEKLTSMLLAAKLKKNMLLKVISSYSAQLAIYKLLIDVAVKSYPKHYKIYKFAIKELPNIKTSHYTPSVGGPKIQKIAAVFGWKIAKIIKYIFKKV